MALYVATLKVLKSAQVMQKVHDDDKFVLTGTSVFLSLLMTLHFRRNVFENLQQNQERYTNVI